MKRILLVLLLLFLNSPAFATDWTADANCQAAWLFNVDEDPQTDSSGEGHTAALKGAGEPAFVASCKFDGCYEWDGANDGMDAGTFDPSTGDLTFVTWMWWDGPNGDWQHVYAKRNDFNSDMRWQVDFRDNASDEIFFGSGDGGTTVTFSESFPQDQWAHMAITNDYDGNVLLYVNGSNTDTTTARAYGGGTTADNMIGTYRDNYNYSLDGKMDDQAIFNDVKDSTDINDMLDNGLEGAAPSGAPPQIW